MKEALIVVPELAPSLNGSRGLMRMHHRDYARVRDRWALLVQEQRRQERFVRVAGRAPLAGPVSVRIVRVYKRLPLDIDNLYSAAKVPLDALCKAGVIVDDDPNVVSELRCAQEKGGEEATVITLRWLPRA